MSAGSGRPLRAGCPRAVPTDPAGWAGAGARYRIGPPEYLLPIAVLPSAVPPGESPGEGEPSCRRRVAKRTLRRELTMRLVSTCGRMPSSERSVHVEKECTDGGVMRVPDRPGFA